MMPAAHENSRPGTLRYSSNRTGDYRPDEHRTTRPHAGEVLEDSRNWPGLILAALGIVAVALTLTAAGYGFAGWAVIGAIASVALLSVGISQMVLEHRRVERRHEEES